VPGRKGLPPPAGAASDAKGAQQGQLYAVVYREADRPE
jgi:hypothetical protein